MSGRLRQQAVLDGIVRRAAGIDAIDGVIVIGSFAGEHRDALSDLDLIAVAAPGRLEEAWTARLRLAGDVYLTWEPAPAEGRSIRWLNWLTHDLVKVECGVAAPGSRELAEPFSVVHGPPALADAFPRVPRAVLDERARRRREQQRSVDAADVTAEELLGRKWSEMKAAARALRARRGSAPPGEPPAAERRDPG